MSRSEVVVVGAGLAGLYAAHLLKLAGVSQVVVLDARARVGGRICDLADLFPQRNLDGFDLGATWVWPGFQRNLDDVIRTLGLHVRAQNVGGDMVVERSEHGPVVQFSGIPSMPPPFRIEGGMSRLVNAIRAGLDPERIHLQTRVVRLTRLEDGVRVEAEGENGQPISFHGRSVLLAVPPRLAQAHLEYFPALPPALQQQWRDTPTHMAPHAKYVAVYSDNFWAERGLSGEARSVVGPLGEVHDASSSDQPALFGFFAYSAAQRARVSPEDLKQRCRTQLARLFGPAALAPLADAIQDWSQDPWTATPGCGTPSAAHGVVPGMTADGGPWSGCLLGAGSEWSPDNPGYVAGAVEAATRAVDKLLASPASFISQHLNRAQQ